VHATALPEETADTPAAKRRARSERQQTGRLEARTQRPLQWLLLALSVPAALLSGLTLYVGLCYGLSGELRDKLYTGTATRSERARLADWRRRVLPVWDAWLVYDDLAQIMLAQGVELGLSQPAGRGLLPGVMRLEAEALRRHPANAFAWARLAYARYVYDGASTLVTEPLLQSIQSAPYEPDLLPSRIVLALQTEAFWSPELTALFPQQLERAWLRQSVETVQAAYKDGITLQLRAKLAHDPDKLARFDDILGDLAPRVAAPTDSQPQ
jgi:hypothetical protein